MRFLRNLGLFAFLAESLAQEYYCPNVSTKGEDRRSNKNSLRVVQFNAEWLFEDGADSCPGTTCPWKTQDDATTHLQSIAKVIGDLDGDIVNLCEVESCHELSDLLATPALSGKNYNPFMVKGTDSSTGQDVGLLTRVDPMLDLYRTENRATYPIPGTTCSSSYYGTYGVSKHYITTFQINGYNIAMIAAHLLAIPDDQTRCVEREAQATVIQGVISSYVSQGYEIIVLGDFNDWDADEVDANGNLPISQVNAILKGQGQSWSLTNVATVMKQSDRYSEWYDEDDDCVYVSKETSMIDHILVSDGLKSKVTNAFIAHDEYAQTCDSFFYSDHWPVVVDFTF